MAHIIEMPLSELVSLHWITLINNHTTQFKLYILMLFCISANFGEYIVIFNCN